MMSSQHIDAVHYAFFGISIIGSIMIVTHARFLVLNSVALCGRGRLCP